jgi:autotransporter-associated beta strand protein
MKTARILLALAVLELPSIISAQTNGNINSQSSALWSMAPWVITSGPGPYPTGGGVATFNEQINTILATPPAVPALTLDVPVTLSSLVFNSIFQYQILAGAGSLSLTTTGTNTINVILSNLSTPTLFAAGDVIAAPIGGGGAFGLTKTGAGTITIAATNTYTGGTFINGGTLRITTGDVALGAAGAGNGLSLDGGILRVSTTALTTSRTVNLGAGGGTFELFANATLNGIVSGSGALSHTVGSTLALTAANTYTGSTSQTFGTISVSGASGTIATSSGYDITGTLALDNSGANNNNRISDTAAITSRGATLTLNGNATAATPTSEAAGALNLASGTTTVTVTPNAANPASLNFADINRLNNSTLFVRGTNLGAAPANGVAQITSTASPGTLIGGGGAAGSTNISILPWAVGNTSASATAGSSFVTWDATSGALRPLAIAEYTTLSSGLSTTDNTRLTAATAIAAPTTVNSVLVATGGTLLTGTGGLNITSGALLYSPTASATGTIGANVNFGAAEGILTNGSSSGLTVSGILSGSNGLTLSSPGGGSITLTGLNTYTGQTILNSGQLTFSGTIDAASAGALGQTSSAIVLNVGTATTRIWTNGTTTINRDLVVTGTPSLSVTAGFGSTSTDTITMNGNIDLQRRLTIENGPSLPVNLNGVISGTGSLTDAFSSLVVLNGNNTYSGGTEIQTGTYSLGSDTGFGTGTIYFSGAGFIQSKDATAHTIANNMLLLATPTFSGTGALNFTGGVNLDGPRTISTTNTGGTTFSGVVTGGSLTKTGTQLLALNSASGNTYTGGTILGTSAGTLNVNNTSGSGTGSGTVSIGTGSTLSGNFTISGATLVSGNLQPGNSVGTANFGSSLSLGTAAITTFELASAASADDLNVSGLFTLDGSVVVLTIGGYIAQQGDTFDLIDWGTINSAGFNVATDLNLTGAATAPGTSWDTSNFLTLGMIMVVPEPSTWTMMGVGASMLLVMMRLRRRSS